MKKMTYEEEDEEGEVENVVEEQPQNQGGVNKGFFDESLLPNLDANDIIDFDYFN
jgi:hypothetical protein